MQQMIFIADLIACSTCFGHHCAHHQELESIIQVVAACRIWCLVFKLSVWCGAEGCVSGLRATARCSRLVLPSVQWIYSWWWAEELSETCRVSCQNNVGKLVHMVGFIIKKFVTMYGHMNGKKRNVSPTRTCWAYDPKGPHRPAASL